MTISEDEIRSIEAEAAPTRFARGWHCLGLARNFRDGEPHSIQAFGQKLVVFMGEDEKVNVLDAYCRHMGGDLSQGTVKGNEVACPFHDWRWGGDGRCKAIPYARRVPLRARTATWPTMEQDGMLFVWNDPEGNPPIEEQAPPRIEGALEDGWTDWVWYETLVQTNAREVIDNNVDMAHFFYVHKSFPTYFKNIFEGHVAAQHMNGLAREDVSISADDRPQMRGNTSVAAYYGPSFMIDDLTYHFDDMDMKTTLINCHYPIDENSFMLQYGIIVRIPEGLDNEAALAIAREQGGFVKAGFEQDVEIWKNKTRIDNPLLCEEDGPVYQLRRWYQQFYVDVADIEPEMTERFEFELDTTKPVEVWKKEVAENLAARGSAPANELV
ncbi:3-ketosteroid-9-alpha-hydroxylase subunit A [Nocardioides sp. JQ2195]|uniref:Rieske 2Fe-2S domain-containing protein n=1 Tax=Nocardioides sp. JQ2195 TaxID=2592334 RepID=UPI00143EAB59|nr:Rieske 2Fe-2S domain-containing protein [Nocardioides sp. JQ2195]QIX26538.1 3-ketosteroid-9-alpha-hydroxylase subunit A [Nocardioides sp. JQ2195]